MSEEHRDIGNIARPVGIILLAGTTAVLALALALTWVMYWRVRSYSDAATIDDVERAAWVTPLFWLGIVVLCLPWIFAWRKMEWDFGCFPVVIAVVSLLISAFFFVRVITVERTVTISTWACEPGYSPFSSTRERIPDGCERRSLPVSIAFGTADDHDRFTAEATGDGRFEVNGLPEGYYHARTTVTAPLETASVILVEERQLTPRAPERLRVDDPAAGEERTWSVSSRLPSNSDSLALLYYPSAQPAQEDAAIIFEVQECNSGSAASFDPADCAPMQMDSPLMYDQALRSDLQHHREPVVTQQGNSETWTNLEARTYTFQPGSPGAYYLRQNNQFLAIQKDGPQTADADELTRLDNGDEVLSIEISPGSGTITYMIYVFPTTTNTIAMSP